MLKEKSRQEALEIANAFKKLDEINVGFIKGAISALLARQEFDESHVNTKQSLPFHESQ